MRTIRTIFEQIKSLSSFPNRGRAGHEEGTRELVLSPLPYFVAYRVREDSVEILYIQHGAQQRN